MYMTILSSPFMRALSAFALTGMVLNIGLLASVALYYVVSGYFEFRAADGQRAAMGPAHCVVFGSITFVLCSVFLLVYISLLPDAWKMAMLQPLLPYSLYVLVPTSIILILFFKPLLVLKNERMNELAVCGKVLSILVLPGAAVGLVLSVTKLAG